MAKKKKFKCECPAGEKWAVPYADFLSLLLALFIALYAIASVNVENQKALKEEFLKIYNFPSLKELIEGKRSHDKASKDDTEEGALEENSLEGMTQEEIQDALDELSKERGNLDAVSEGVTMDIPADLLFVQGEAVIKGVEGVKFIQKVAQIINNMPPDTVVTVKGYALNSEISTLSPYKDTIDLSSARANNVARELIKLKIPKDRVVSSAYAFNKSGLAKVEFEFNTQKQELKSDMINVEELFENKTITK